MPNRPLLPTVRAWWLVLLVMLVLAGGLYFTGYQISLPYVDHPDEPSFNLAAQMIIDSGTAKPMGYNAYPPGIISVNYLVLKAFNETVRRPASDFIPLVRLITITVGLGSVLAVALLGYELAGEWAGLFAAFLWAINPIWNAHLRFATADPYITTFALLALWLVCAGSRRNHERLNTAATAVLMLAIVFKTQAIFLLPLILFLPLLTGWGRGDAAARRRLIRAWAWNAFRWTLFLFWLLALYPTLDANKIVQWVAPTDKIAFPTPQLLAAHVDITLLSTRPLLAWGIVVVILGAGAWYGRDVVSRGGLLAVVTAFGLFLFGISLFGLQSSRQMYFLVAVGDLLTGVALAVLIRLSLRWLAARRSLPASAPAAAYGVIVLYVLAATVPAVTASVESAQDALKPDQRNALAVYMDTSLPPAPHIANQANHKTLNRDYGGYHGVNDFPLVAVANLTDKPLDDWRAKQAAYAVVSYDDDWQAYAPGQVLLLKSFPPDTGYRGPAMRVLRLWPMQNRLDEPLRLGSIKVIGYDVSDRIVTAGSDVTLTYYWQADAPTPVPYRVFTHVYPLDRVAIIAQQDGLPLADDLERRPTSRWDDPAEVLVSRPFRLMIPADTAAGRYRVAIGFYDPAGDSRLATASGDSFVTVTTIRVQASAP